MAETSSDRILRLRGGRRLGYAEYGDPAGAPLLAFHGTPGSRLVLAIADRPARAQGVRLIAPDRPGLGLSDFHAGRTFADWPDDVRALADALAIHRFAVVGISGGAPYAAACACKMPERLTSLGIVSGVGPLPEAKGALELGRRHRVAFSLAARAPWLARGLMVAARFGWRRFPDRIFARIVAWSPPQDRAILTRPDVRACLIDGLVEAFRGGGAGVAHELVLLGRPWGFPLEEIRVPVRLWHGEVDAVVPPVLGRSVAASIPTCRATFIPDAGHYWVFTHMEGLIRTLCPVAA